MLVHCHECSKEISSEAVACPHCGYRYNYERVALIDGKTVRLSNRNAELEIATEETARLQKAEEAARQNREAQKAARLQREAEEAEQRKRQRMPATATLLGIPIAFFVVGIFYHIADLLRQLF